MAAKKEKFGTATPKDYDVIRNPIFTEKSSIVGGDGSVVVFRVVNTASKADIKRAVQRVFQVGVRSVRTCQYQGKLKRTVRQVGHRASWKKAYVALQPGENIDLVEGL